SLSEELVKREGIYYTPLPVIRFMIERSLTLLTSKSNLRVLDPACGAGLFLVEVFTGLLSRRSKNSSCFRVACDIIENNIFGVDKDADAIGVCRRSISEAFTSLVGDKLPVSAKNALEQNILVGNSLFEPEDLPFDLRHRFNPIPWRKNFPTVFSRKNPG